MRHISSKDNSVIRTARSLHQKKHRDQSGLFLAEGPHLIEEAVLSGLKIAFAVVCDALPDFGNIEQTLSGTGAQVYTVPEGLLQGVFDTGTPQGVIAAVYKPVFDEARLLGQEKGNWLVLDRLQDPGNVGTMIRTAEAAGMTGIIALKGTVDVYAPKVVRSAAGAICRMPVFFYDRPEEAVGALKKAGKFTAAALPEAGVDYYEAPLSQDVALLIGSEAKGLCEELRQSADIKVRIPMAGRTESLNAAVAAAVLMYETIRPKV